MTTNSSSLTYDESIIGKEVEVGSFEVTAEQIKAYCEAIGETSPLYTDEVVAKEGPYGGIIAPPPGHVKFLPPRTPSFASGGRSPRGGPFAAFGHPGVPPRSAGRV